MLSDPMVKFAGVHSYNCRGLPYQYSRRLPHAD